MTQLTRRSIVGGTAAIAGALAMPSLARAQGAPLKIGTLTPLTGSGGTYGPPMANVIKRLIEEVNAAGGVDGQPVLLVQEDDQTNPEAGLRAARKLIDVDRVAAITGTWASAVTTAVAPVCAQAGVMLTTTSGADSITLLPHQGFLIRTQPNTTLQGRKFGEFALELGGKSVAFVSPQTPFTDSQFAALQKAVQAGGGTATKLIYDDKKATLRTEVDQVLRAKPDVIVMGGYATDTAVLVRDLYRANSKAKLIGFGYSVNKQLIDALPVDVSEGIYTLSPSSTEGSNAYKRVAALAGTESPDPYTCQIFDQVSLCLLAAAAGKGTTGTTIKDNIRKIAQGGGEKVDDVREGLKLVAAGKKIDYDGASGPCDFTDIGDITDAKFRYEQVKNQKLTLIRIA